MKPKRRSDSLIVKKVQDETIVYDLTNQKACCLNPTAALVWGYCDGETTVSKMVARLEKDLGVETKDAVVWRALDQLRKARLLEEPVGGWPEMRTVSRRELLRSARLAAALLPFVASIVVPTAASAMSCANGNCIPNNACRAGIDTCTCCGPPNCVKKCDANGNCSNAVAGC